MKYKVGDRVVVKRGLKMYERSVYVTNEMEEQEGSTVTISRADSSNGTYKVEGLLSWFEEEMFEPVEQFSRGGIVPADNSQGIVSLGEMINPNQLFSCGTVRLTLSNERKDKSVIESRKEIRKRLLKL